MEGSVKKLLIVVAWENWGRGQEIVGRREIYCFLRSDDKNLNTFNITQFYLKTY